MSLSSESSVSNTIPRYLYWSTEFTFWPPKDKTGVAVLLALLALNVIQTNLLQLKIIPCDSAYENNPMRFCMSPNKYGLSTPPFLTPLDTWNSSEKCLPHFICIVCSLYQCFSRRSKHWFQSVRTCPYSWATGRNNIPSFLKRAPAGARWIVCGNLCGVWQVVSINWARGRHPWACGRYQSLLGTYSVFPLRPVGRCEGLIQLKKAHCDSAWPIAANAAIWL